LAAERHNRSDSVNIGSAFETCSFTAFRTSSKRTRRISIKDLTETIARLTGFDGPASGIPPSPTLRQAQDRRPVVLGYL